ncbi:MAG: LysM peptidoglycan-binding domain-containing protein [Verrucomicrobiota bacterium]
MNTHSKRYHRQLALLILAITLPMLTQCGGIGGYKSISYSKGKLSTPPTTLSQRDYPFDSKGRYRTDWVKGGSTKKRSKSSFNTAAAAKPQPQTQSTIAQSPPKSSSQKSKSSTSSSKIRSSKSSKAMSVASNTSYPPKSKAAPEPKYTPPPAPAPPKPKPAPKKAEARYHTIAKGDTLWGISRRYKVGIAAIKSANGLSTDLIRPGQTLRIP